MSGAFVKDMARCWLRSWKRFASIAVISLLGVAVLTGIYAGCRDMFLGADRFYDAQGLRDIQVVSTLGLTDDDVSALRGVSGVEDARGVRSQSVKVPIDGAEKTVTITEIVGGAVDDADGSSAGSSNDVGDSGSAALDRPYLQDGRMPTKSGEVAVTRKFLKDSGYKLGDVLTVTPVASSDSTGMSGSDGSPSDGTASDTATSSGDDSVDASANGSATAGSSDSGSSESTDSSSSPSFPTRLTIVGVVLDLTDLSNPDGIGSEAFRNNAAADYAFFAPSDGVTGDTYTSISLSVAGAKAEDTFSDRYDDTVGAVADRIENTIQAKRQKVRRQQLVDEAERRIDDARAEAESKFAEAQSQIDQQRAQFNQQVDALAAQAARSQAVAQNSGRTAANATTAAAAANVTVTPELRQSVINQSPQLQQAQAQIDQAQSDLDNRKSETTKQLDDQTKKIEENIPQSRWYVRTRAAIGGFSQLKSDVSSIESIGRAFPIVFLTVAVLMSLTTMTRMVEEERGLIGTYVGLGYGPAAIAARYVLFAALACLIGGGLGLVAGFLGIPAFLLVVLKGLYTIPDVRLEYDWVYGSAGIALFVVGIVVATVVACAGELRQTPAALMRPKAPKAGTRVLLERVRPVWRRMGFLNKVTVRNIMRFKSRLIMTVGGVAGCTALIVCGLAINDSVDAIPARQYQDIYRYDLMVVTDHDDLAAVEQRLRDDGRLDGDAIPARVESGEMTNGDDESATVQLVTVPRAADMRSIAALHDVDGGAALSLSGTGVIVSRSAANALGVAAGDEIALQNGDSERATARVSAVSESVIGSDLYLTTAYYKALFGADATDSGGSDASDGDDATTAVTVSNGVGLNAVYANLKGSDDAQVDYAAKLGRDAKILSAVSSVRLERSFEFKLMAAVVALIVGLAGGLALVVLFTLANTNVSERVREMATLKVLGFYDREVHTYVNKEMLILTLAGIAVGLPLGRWVGGLLTAALNMPGMYFEVHVRPASYLIAAAVTLAFALLVQLLTNPVLDRIDPATSLKSVE
ncbi:FtsX-like permease family protein [Bifidobacterium sp. MA2]|uniref:FtsX-like permease family protein n=1 Tax=Bifidobacterium santillanense TaxID=2809028 RepID=A0ABS5UQ80_9BIFI|nr:FtsX-like permease family protein [Bifidobacterium santillanense]MBT1173130.1 FtsX-like permease family protein [Bifidobacterium santillanense]